MTKDFGNCTKMNDQILLTLIGHLSFGLIERYKKNKKKINIVSCDNLSNNGKILKKVIKKKKVFYFALEDLKLSNKNDLQKIEHIWLVKKTLPYCLKKI